MIDRRTLMGSAIVLAAASATPAAAMAATPPAPAAGKKIGLQLYTLRNIFQPDPVGTLEKVAAIGYREIEYGGGGYDKMDHAMLRRTQDRLGLSCPSIHVGYDELLNSFEASVTRARTLGAGTIVLPYMQKEHFAADAWTKAVANMNRFADALQKQGIGFAYHNHDFEFTVKPDGVSLFDRLLKDRNSLLMIELDLFWAAKAGEDVEARIRQLAGTLFSYHVKDMTADGKMAAVGAGTLDFARWFRLNALAGVRHFFVENDQAPEPYLPDVTTSYANLRALLSKA